MEFRKVQETFHYDSGSFKTSKGISGHFWMLLLGFSGHNRLSGEFQGVVRRSRRIQRALSGVNSLSVEFHGGFRELQIHFSTFQSVSGNFKGIQGISLKVSLKVKVFYVCFRWFYNGFKTFQTDDACRSDELYSMEFVESLKQTLNSLLDST